jgi:hypothetical protein
MPALQDPEAIAAGLEREAAARFGEERARELSPLLQERARHFWLVAQAPVERDEVPALLGGDGS